MLLIKKPTSIHSLRSFASTAAVATLAASLFLGSALQAQQPAAPAPAPVLVKPVPLMQEGLFIPGMGNEGFITASYTVKADGTTDDIEILGGFSNPFYEKTIRDNIAKWTFTPGTVNGEAQDFVNQLHTFKIQVAATLGVSPDVQMELAAIQSLLEAKDYEKARDEIERVLKNSVHSVLDYGLLNQMMASAQMGLQDPFSALEYIRKATAHTVNMEGNKEYILTPEILQSSLRQQVLIAATVRAQHDVLQTWAELDEVTDIASDDPVRQWLATAEQQVASPDPLLALGEITDDAWEHTPTHRIFTVADVREGRLDKIIAHCERRTLELDYQEGVDWNLPASFGDCQLSFEGKDGTLFSIYEFAQ